MSTLTKPQNPKTLNPAKEAPAAAEGAEPAASNLAAAEEEEAGA